MLKPRTKRRLKRSIWITLVVVAGLVALINNWVINNSEAYIYDNFALLPDNDVGLVLGTSPFTRGGKPNPQFYGRIDAAVQLYKAGKIKHLIVSGANPDSNYNEPRQMWKELTKDGVPSQAITMDFAGFRTLDSISRAQAVFGLDRMTIITQRYHAYRAVFIAKKLHMRVAAFAPSSDETSVFSRTLLREIPARVKAVLDIYIFDAVPKFFGERRGLESGTPPEAPAD
jgi:SanA protein